MLSEQEQLQIRLLSDNELYPQAIELIQGLGRALPQTQINGLLNVSLGDTYDHLKRFVKRQQGRSTWAARDRHIPDFYKKFSEKLLRLEKEYVPLVTKLRPEQVSPVDLQAIRMALARELIQHILAENTYKAAVTGFQAGPDENHAREQRAQNGRGESRR